VVQYLGSVTAMSDSTALWIIWAIVAIILFPLIVWCASEYTQESGESAWSACKNIFLSATIGNYVTALFWSCVPIINAVILIIGVVATICMLCEDQFDALWTWRPFEKNIK
jgi:hypothetical protein